MTLQELRNELKKLKIPEDTYYFHGLYGSTEDRATLALTIKHGKYYIEHETYLKERDQINSLRAFSSEDQARKFFLDKKISELAIMNSLQNDIK